MTSRFLYILLYIGIAMSMGMTMQSCSDDSPADVTAGQEIQFRASIRQSSGGDQIIAGSRAVVEGEYEVMTPEVWEDWDIHIHHKNLSNSSVAEEERLYYVAGGTQGELTIKTGDADKWLWGVSATDNDSHIFQAWTDVNRADGPVVVDDNMTIDFEAGNNKAYDNGSYIGRYLNFLIGTAAGPVDYKTTGLYVPMYFRHLVSRIRLISIIRYYGDGTFSPYNNTDILDMEFPKMFRTGTLATNAGIQNSDGSAMFPEVVTTSGIHEQGLFVDLKYDGEMLNVDGGLPVYVPPFSFVDNGDFSVGIFDSNTQPEHGGEKTYNTYHGSLAEVFLDRDDHQQELLAGESMDLMLELKDDDITGIYVYINPWNTVNNQDVLQHPRPGVYSADEFKTLLQGLRQNPPEIPESMYEIVDGQKVVRLYSDISFSLVGESTLNIPDGIVLDGMGHNIACNGNLTITGNVRDVRVNGVAIN